MPVTLLAPRILWWLVDFCKIYAALFYFNVCVCVCVCVCEREREREKERERDGWNGTDSHCTYDGLGRLT